MIITQRWLTGYVNASDMNVLTIMIGQIKKKMTWTWFMEIIQTWILVWFCVVVHLWLMFHCGSSDGGGDAKRWCTGLAQSSGIRREHLPTFWDVRLWIYTVHVLIICTVITNAFKISPQQQYSLRGERTTLNKIKVDLKVHLKLLVCIWDSRLAG